MEFITEFINQVVINMKEWADNTDTYWERVLVWIMIAYIELKIMLLDFASAIATTLIQSAGLTDALTNAWGGVSGDTLSVLSYLGIPDAVNIVLSAFVTRFILDMLP